MKAVLTVEIDAQLKEIVGQMADRNGQALNEFVANALSRVAKRPDLAAIPRKKLGRPRKPLATA